MTSVEDFYAAIKSNSQKWLVTGCAGFIGTNLVKKLLELNQQVVGLDNFSTGKKENIDLLKKLAETQPLSTFHFYEGDICKTEDCLRVVEGVDIILHQAALGSVPRSLLDPIASHQANVTGFINILWAAKNQNIKRIVYASSSSVYGDSPKLPKVEDQIGNPLSPYAATKLINEIYAHVFQRSYGLELIGLRYFNVFGPHQQPDGPYAAVIPKWIGAMLDDKPIQIFGDGETSRDFCFVENVVQMNLRAATTKNAKAVNQEYNVAFHQQTSLNQLYSMIKTKLCSKIPNIEVKNPSYEDFRPGDVRHSLADITKSQELLDYKPSDDIESGMDKSISWYIQDHQAKRI